MLPELPAYEQFVYTLQQRHPSILHSTLVIVRHGATFAELTGIVAFANEVTLGVWEDLNFAMRTIQGYSYAVNQGGQRLWWYDPQPHPNEASLASTHPHHKHIPPEIKRHRVPAPGLSFDQPNLPFLIGEIEHELLAGQ